LIKSLNEVLLASLLASKDLIFTYNKPTSYTFMPLRPYAFTAIKALRVLLIGDNAARRDKPIKSYAKLFIIIAKVEILYAAAFSKK
jgi:hypothetical protein